MASDSADRGQSFTLKTQSYSLESLINESESKWDEPERGFPKGRKNFQEKELTCALREFNEETGVPKSYIKVAINIMPYNEIFTGSNLKSYKHSYFLGFMSENLPLDNNYQKTEVSDVKWLNFDDCMNKIRDYNCEKKEILTKINNVIKKYRLYS